MVILFFCLTGKTYHHEQTKRRLNRSFQQTKAALDAFDEIKRAFDLVEKACHEAQEGWKDCLDEKNQL